MEKVVDTPALRYDDHFRGRDGPHCGFCGYLGVKAIQGLGFRA